MKPLLLVIAAATAVDLVRGQAYVCDFPTNGCSNGMFNQIQCECQCIPPFCLDVYGDCLNPTGSCGGNPWLQCQRGVDCPWYANPMKQGYCTTGPQVPADVWDVYTTRDACCSTNFPYSESCNAVDEEAGPPTKHPTIAAPEDDDYEVVPIKFDIGGLPDNISMRDLKDEMLSVMTRILIRLADKIQGMKISGVEEKIVLQRERNLMKALLRERALQEDAVTLYYNVNVIRVPGRKFGPLIIEEMRQGRSEILYEIQSFTDTNFFGGGDLDMNWCTSQNGKYEDCVVTPPKARPERAPPPFNAQGQGGSDPDGGNLAGWVIALIIICILLLLCCIGYCVFVSFFKDYDDNKEIRNNIYMDDRSGYDSRGMRIEYDSEGRPIRGSRDRALAIEDDRSRATENKSRRSGRSQNDGSVQLILDQPQDPKFDDDSFTVNTYGTRKDARDPTMYIPGQEGRPDPDSSGRSISSRSRRYLEDPPLKPKRDPTMFLEGQRDPTLYVEGQRDPTMYVEGQRDPTMYMEGNYSAGDPPLKPQRDPTMYVEGQQDAYTEDGYGSDPYGMGGIDEEEDYDKYGFKQPELDAEYMTSETNAEYTRGSRDPSYFDDPNASELRSVRTQDPSVSGKSGRSKQSRRSKPSKRSSRR